MFKDCVLQPPKEHFRKTTDTFKFQHVSVLSIKKHFYKETLSIKKHLKSLKRNKEAGLDDLPPGMLKDCCDYIEKPLGHIINLSLVTTIVPSEWKKAKVIPLYKSGKVNEAENYRPILILAILSKLLEWAVQEQIRDYLEQRSLISKFQIGYRPNRSTQQATILLTDKICFEANDKKLVRALFLDLSKAFDTISYSVLLNKLKAYVIDNEELEWFASYLFCRSQVVDINNKRSNEFYIYRGVPQGSILGPLLFLIFFNDFPDALKKWKVLMYSDEPSYIMPIVTLMLLKRF